MGLMDAIKKKTGGAKSATQKNAGMKEKAEQGVDAAAKEADKRTGGKHAKKIDKAADAARGRLGTPKDKK